MFICIRASNIAIESVKINSVSRQDLAKCINSDLKANLQVPSSSFCSRSSSVLLRGITYSAAKETRQNWWCICALVWFYRLRQDVWRRSRENIYIYIYNYEKNHTRSGHRHVWQLQCVGTVIQCMPNECESWHVTVYISKNSYIVSFLT